MIKDVDKSDVIDVHCIMSSVLGTIPVESISGGVKTLILMGNDNIENICGWMYKCNGIAKVCKE